MKRIIGKTALCFFLISITTGFIYQSYSSFIDSDDYKLTGKFINLGGYNLHAEFHGEGELTVIFDAGMGDSLLAWNKVVPEVSRVAKVFSYDRAGLGWSEKSPLPRTSLNIVEELRLLLEKSNIKGPLILVGHSFGGLNMQLFSKMYPNDVAGLILVDSAHENQHTVAKPGFFRSIVFKAGMWAAPLGIPRLYLSLDNPKEQAVKSTIKHQYTSLDESEMFANSMSSLQKTRWGFGELPITVIAKNFPSSLLIKNKNSSWRNIELAKLQEELAQRSSNSRLIFSENRQHAIHRSQPHLVIEAIKQMIKLVENDV